MLRSFLLLLHCLPAFLFAQEHRFGPYELADTTELFNRLDRIEQQAAAQAADSIDTYIEDYLGERTDLLKTSVLDSSFLFDAGATEYVTTLLRKITAANSLDVDPTVFITRDPDVNAISLGDGLLFVNVGLLQAVTTERGLAFVLSHELAHDQLRHSHHSMAARAGREKADDQAREEWESLSRAKRRRILRMRRRSGDNGTSLGDIRDFIYQDKRQRRANELAADSLGMQYLLASGYPKEAATDAMLNFRSTYFSVPEGSAAKYLNAADYPFRPEWTAPPQTLFGGSFGGSSTDDTPTYWNQDSMRTHPDLSVRLDQLATTVDTTLREDNLAHPYGTWARRERLRSFLFEKHPVHTLILAINALDRIETGEEVYGPADLYHATVADALLEVVRSIDRRYFDTAVPPKSYFGDPGAQELTVMFQQMDRTEIKALTDAYTAEWAAKFPDSPYLQWSRRQLADYLP